MTPQSPFTARHEMQAVQYRGCGTMVKSSARAVTGNSAEWRRSSPVSFPLGGSGFLVVRGHEELQLFSGDDVLFFR